MLKKFISIRNVGRFQKYCAVGDVGLKRYNLFFAENGRGKTTLCAILRSLQSGAAAHVLGRTTLGSTDAPEIRILSDAATLVFSAGAWSNTVADIAIFDSTFISENVFSGDSVRRSTGFSTISTPASASPRRSTPIRAASRAPVIRF